jgi:hypothetical protein
MRDENMYKQKLVVSRRIINSLPRYGLCQRSSRPFQHVEEESSDDKESDEGEIKYCDYQALPGSKPVLELEGNFETAFIGLTFQTEVRSHAPVNLIRCYITAERFALCIVG